MPLSDYYKELAGWKPVQPLEPLSEIRPAIPDPNAQVSAFLRTTQPLVLQYQQDTIKQYNRPGLSSYRVAPLAPNASAVTQAASASTAKIVSQQVIAATSSGMQTVGLIAPKEAVITNSPLSPPGGNINWSWATESPGYVFQAPPPGLSGYQGSSYATFLSIVGGGTMTVSQTPTTSTSLGLLTVNAGSAIGTPAGWTAIGASQTFYKAITGTSPVSVAFSIASQIDAETSLSLFNGPAPAFVQGSTGNTASGTISQTNTAGNTLIVSIRAQQFSPAAPISIVVSDSLGNIYQQITNQSFVGNGVGTKIMFQESTWVVSGCLGGANVISWNITGPGTISTSAVAVAEFGPLPTGNNIPFFAPISGALIPPINLAASGNGGVGGILKVANGGTGVTTSTGTGNVVLSASPTFTGTTALASATFSSTITNYDGNPTVGEGIPSIQGLVDKVTQSAAIATTTLMTTPGTGPTQFRLSWNAKVTTAATTSSTLGGLTITYTDPDGVVQTITAAAQNSIGAIITSINNGGTTSVMLGLDMLLNCKASTNIQYAFAYASSGVTAMQYNLHIRLEAL